MNNNIIIYTTVSAYQSEILVVLVLHLLKQLVISQVILYTSQYVFNIVT